MQQELKVNPDEAPEGYVAVEQSIDLCIGCYFDMKYSCILPRSSISCVARHREDKKTVIFIKNMLQESASNFTNEILKDIAHDCGFTVVMKESGIKNNMKEIEIFASKVFEAGVKFGKEQANKELN